MNSLLNHYGLTIELRSTIINSVAKLYDHSNINFMSTVASHQFSAGPCALPRRESPKVGLRDLDLPIGRLVVDCGRCFHSMGGDKNQQHPTTIIG